ncbi:MAG TPA: hypothetical protein VFC63_18200, partial [Blastocatellia bacterium]|nr:hypothetical protein [Blastocatellia bacterium]
KVEKVYTVLDGLPENDLTSLGVYQNHLYIGTPHEGLVSFDGSYFVRYKFKQPVASNVHVLVPTESELLIGTFDGGLFEFDGQTFTRRFQKTKGADFKSVTALAKKDSRVYIGTQDKGLFVWREGHIDHFTHLEGLPSDRITGILDLNNQVLIATDFGIAELGDNNQILHYSSQPNVTSLVNYSGELYAGLFTGGVVQIRRDQQPISFGKWETNSSAGLFRTVSDVQASPVDVRLTLDAAGMWALTENGLYKLDNLSFKPTALVSNETELRHGHVTSLAFDWNGRLWVGYFDGGIDVLLPETNERFSHFEDANLREVNFLRADKDHSKMLVATSAGLVTYDSRLIPQRLSEREGLISDSVMHISFADGIGPDNSTRSKGQTVVLSTGKGLTMVQGAVPRSLSPFNGLTSPYVYTSLQMNGRLYLGTLGGLSEIERMRVTRTYTASNSKLQNNWITALADIDGTLFIGTNGGGVQALTPAGDWVDFKDEIGRFDVNFNAMLYDHGKLYVGTLDRGVMIFDTRTRQWTTYATGLGSHNVTAIVADADHIYFGTTNGITKAERRIFN